MKKYFFIVASILFGSFFFSCEEEDDDIGEPDVEAVESLRTPDDRFESLPGYNFDPHYITLDNGIRVHYVDEGPEDGPIAMLVHGNPGWSYLNRDLVQPLVEQGYRVIMPDLVGFGRSDKPVNRSEITYDSLEDWMTEFVEKLGFSDVYLYAHDWGGGVFLRIAIKNQDLFKKIAISNTGLAAGDPLPESFLIWADSISQVVPSYAIVFDIATATQPTQEELEAYEVPYPSEEYKAAPRQLPQEVPISPDDPVGIENRELTERYSEWTKPFIVLSGGPTGSTLSVYDSVLINIAPGAQDQPHALIEGSGHYVQEDQPEELVQRLINFFNAE
jgi:haloalkane dehalogenase